MTRTRGPDRSDWILLALLAANGNMLTAVKLQKTLFVLGERRPRDVGDDYYVFQPYHYGPFDAAVYHDADELENDGLIEVDRSQGRALRRYVLTDGGRRAAQKAAKHQSRKAQTYLAQVVEWAQPLPFNMLVRAIYDAFPAMRANSIFEER
jgi:uncharacterized protein YwgA